MTFAPSHPSSPRRWLGRLFGLALLAMGALGVFGWPQVTSATARLTAPDPVTAAWEKVQAAGSYHFTSDVTQMTAPLATLTNVGRNSRTEKLYLEGQNDLNAQKMALTLWSQGGSALQADSGIGLRTENGKTFTRHPGGDWQETDDVTGAIAPQGDFLSYLAAIKDVQAQPVESRGGIDFTRYTFTIDSARFAAHMHKQMEAALRARGELPPGLHLSVPTYFRDMVGAGELWVGNDGLPLRQILTLQFPEQNDEQVNTQIVVNFSQFGFAQSIASVQSTGASHWFSAASLSALTINTLPYVLLLSLFACAMLLIYFRRAHRLQMAVVFLVILAQLVGPLLSAYTNVRYFDTQSAKAAAAKARQAEAKSDLQIRKALGTVEFNPHANPLETRDSAIEASLPSPVSSLPSAPALQTIDSGLDADLDTLTDFVEERIGTSEVISDTDSDGLNDPLEVTGFLFDGQRWYTNPSSSYSNGDGLGDAIEWGVTDTGLRATPQDSDGDGYPDLFDSDNDSDGVPDNRDLAAFSKVSTPYDAATPLKLTLKNLTDSKPTFVEFQIRPQDEKQLWFAYNVLDWPQDSIGQVRDVDGKTYADVVSSGSQAAANDANGDMKVVPMLEIRIPADSANLPPQSDLTPFNISINNFTADGQTKVAYVPLSIVTDDKTGQRVAFSGQMRYLPTGIWNSPHEVRLSWVVQALIDMPCNPEDSAQVAQGCQRDPSGQGYIHNVAQPIQSYYSSWSLTGLGVREDHGATIALIYEDPTHDDNLKDDKAIWALSYVLDHHFALGRDDNHDNQRDLTINDLATRFDFDNSPSEAQRFAVPNILQVETQSYATLNQAAAFTAMTTTVQLLNNVFKPVVTNDRAIKPLLFFAQESSSRALTLDGATSSGYVTENGGALTLDMAPSGKPAQTTSVTAGIKWMGYCAPSSGDVSFKPCTAEEYWDVLDARYLGLPLEAGETNPDLITGRLMMAQLYYMGLTTGYQGTVQDGQQVLSAIFGLESEDETATTVRAVLRTLATVPLVADRAFLRIFVTYKVAQAKAGGLFSTFSDFYKSLKLPKPSSTATTKQIHEYFGYKRAQFLARVGPLAAAGAVLMLVTQIISMLPDLPPTARTVIGSLSIALNIGLNLVMPIVEAAFFFRSGTDLGIKALTQTFKITSTTRIAGLVGLAISTLVIWGFFFYAMANGNLKAGDPALNRAFFEAVAATIIAILLTILASNPIGLIIGAILGILDLILTLICELGNKDLRNVPGMDGACFTLTGAVTKALTKILYSYDLMVNMERSDLMATDAPQVDLANPAKGYVFGNSVSITLPVTTTIMHKNPDSNNGVIIYSYLYLFSADNLKRSTFKYALSQQGNTTPAAALDEMTGSWQNLRIRNAEEGGEYQNKAMYRADMRTVPAPLTGAPLPVGINATVPFTLNMGFAIPAYECFTVLVVPVCYVRSYTGDNHLPINSLQYDVFPATLSEFLALTPKADSGLGLGWDAKFGSLRDADGDGLIAFTHNGLDPNDNSVDSDNDGLIDLYELQSQSSGSPMSPIQRDTDNDSLTDYQEQRLGSDPAIADSDNDGLKDGEEVYHLRYDPNTGLPTTVWEGGWDVTINATTPFVVRVSSDPFLADTDGDSVNDQAERQLAQSANPADRLDNQNRPYHPAVFNTPPLAVFVATNDQDNYLKPGQALIYTSTVVANTAVVSGVLNVNVPTVLGSTPNPLALAFNPLTFTTTQTVTRPINLSVAGNATTQQTFISSTASTRLPNTGAGGWRFAPVNAEAPLAIAAPTLPRFTDLSASHPDRQDNYRLATLANQDLGPFGVGDILAYAIPAGTVTRLENDANNVNAYMQTVIPSLATNANGDTLAVWGEFSNCNTVTFNWLKVVTAGSDHGTSGIEPFLAFERNDGSEQQIWYWTAGTGGGNDVTSGSQYGPNGAGFPITRSFCGGPGTIRVYESDGPVADPAQNTLIAFDIVGLNGHSRTATFSNGDQTIEVNYTVPPLDRNHIVGKIIGADGTVKRTLTFPASPVPTTYQRFNQGPAVASDGNGFLVAYESFSETFVENAANTYGLPQIVVQGFDKDGNALSNSYRDANSLQNESSANNPYLTVDVAWIGNTYRLVWQDRRLTNVYMADVPANGAAIGSSTLVFDRAQSNIDRDEAPKVSYDPISNRSLVMLLTNSRDILNIIYQGADVFSAYFVDGQWYAPQIAWSPVFQGWLLGYQSNADRTVHTYAAFDSEGMDRFAPVTGFAVTTGGNSLACPAPQSVPVVDLRFEELPAPSGLPTTFADLSGYGNNATCSGANCPAAGFSGAPNATLSDYAVLFDGVDDGLTLNRTVQDNFTIAFWLKAPTGSGAQMLVDGGSATANGFQILLNNGALAVDVPGASSQQSGRIDDDQWHFVTVNRNGASGRVEAYVDGNRVINTVGTVGVTLNGVSDLRLGKNRSDGQPLRGALEHLQIIPATLAQETVQALFNRTNQSYCLTAGVNASNIYWGKVQASQPDVRGGRISASNGLSLTIDNDLPTASFTALTNNETVGSGLVIGGSATDATSGVGLVEVSVNNGAWLAASGANSWAFSLAGYNGAISLRVRATDNVGNVGNPSAAINLTIDSVTPVLSISGPTDTVKPTKNAAGRWQVTINGTVSEAASGIKADSLLVRLEPQTNNVPLQSEQQATVNGNNWSINYLLNDGLFDPTGVYSVTVQAMDTVGNRATPATGVVRLDARGPEAVINPSDTARTVISQTLTIGGVVSDTTSIVGIDKLEIAFTSLAQLATLPTGITSDQAEALPNRTWTPVTLAQRGAGVTTTTWSFQLPAGLENNYQIDLRGTDMKGNVAISSNIWQGLIDTTNPRVVMTATDTGVTYFNAASNRQEYAISFFCAALDRELDQETFVCPGESVATATRSYTSTAALQALFPDLTIVNGLALSYTAWMTTTTPLVTASACDTVGRCAQASTAGAGAAASGTVQAATLQAAAPGAPTAVIVNPTGGSFVAAGNAISVTVAAEAGAGLKDVTIKLDNAVVQTLSFAQSPAITRTLRTVNVPVATEGQHTLVAQATAWDNSAQTTLFPVVFTLDQNAPSLTIDASVLTLADTWVAQSGVLRFNGNAVDSVGLAAVQIREGNTDFTDATFGGGTWRVALPVADPEGRSLNITVRAIDRAGRITQLNQAIATDLSAADAPDTTISSGPTNPSNVNSAQFVFTGSATAAAFECSLDNGVYTPCASPTNYSELSKGSHTFRVRAIDGRGLPDLTPAEYTWTVNAGQPDATITGKPTNPTTERTATFTFSGDATATRFECSLDGGAYVTCTSPITYNNLGNGDHTFLARARNSANAAGAADRYVWTVVNVAPVANSQTVIVIPNQAKSITLSATDNEPLLYTIVTPPTHGVLSGIAPNLSYSPDTGYGGPDSFTFKASDGLAESNLATVTIFVDNVPPVVTCPVTPNNLWPPNHKLISIQATVTVTDVHSGPAGFTLLSVTSNEPDAGLNKDDVPVDIQNWVAGTPDVVGQVRAERSDTGTGRIYTLTYEGKDLAGNKALCTTTVTVPKSQGGRTDATYDETLVLPDAYVDAQPAPADPVNAPVSDAPATDAPPTNSEAQTLKLFLPLVTNEAVNQ